MPKLPHGETSGPGGALTLTRVAVPSAWNSFGRLFGPLKLEEL